MHRGLRVVCDQAGRIVGAGAGEAVKYIDPLYVVLPQPTQSISKTLSAISLFLLAPHPPVGLYIVREQKLV